VGIGQGAVAITPVQLMRAIAAISMDGKMVVPHVVNPTQLPSGMVEVQRLEEVRNISVDTGGWNLITDAMSRVLLPEGTAPSAHIPGIDIAGKTGSAQIVSLALRAKHTKNDDFAQNGWFVGFTPRRNPEIIVVVLFEGGEHGKLAARLATQVIKAYVDKKRRQPNQVVETDPGRPKALPTETETEMASLWTDPSKEGSSEGTSKESSEPGENGEQRLQAGRFSLEGASRPEPVLKAAPGLEASPNATPKAGPRARPRPDPVSAPIIRP
jgi:penicillin-binding protein 2